MDLSLLIKMWIELPIFIHGVDINEEPESHKPQFMELLEMVNENLKDINKIPLEEEPIMLEWGSELSDGEDSFLSGAEQIFMEKVFEAVKESRAYRESLLSFFHNITRKVFIFGLTDAIFYFSTEGGKIIKESVYRDIKDAVEDRLKNNPDEGVSLTILAHSAGSVIAYDLLYDLHKDEPDYENEDFVSLRRYIVEDRLRVRKLYTFGSPFALSIFRDYDLVMKLINDEKIDAEVLGFNMEDDLSLPRWVNFYELSDVFSYPVGFLFSLSDGEKVVEDYFLSSGDLTAITAHGKYFELEEIAEYIAETF